MWRSQEKILGHKVNLNFSRHPHNGKVTDFHAFFRILRFVWILDLQNFVRIFQKFLDFLSSNSDKKYYFRFKRKLLLSNYDFGRFSINPHIPRVYGKFPKVLII